MYIFLAVLIPWNNRAILLKIHSWFYSFFWISLTVLVVQFARSKNKFNKAIKQTVEHLKDIQYSQGIRGGTALLLNNMVTFYLLREACSPWGILKFCAAMYDVVIVICWFCEISWYPWLWTSVVNKTRSCIDSIGFIPLHQNEEFPR